MSSNKKALHYFIFITVLILSACQMPVRPDKNTTTTPAPPIEQSESSPSIPAPTPITDASTITDTTPTAETPAAEIPATRSEPNKQTGAAVFVRLRNNFSGPICRDSAAINLWKKRYAGNPKSFSNHLGEILPLLDYVSLEVERRHLPAEFALIPIIESWYQPHAIGSGGPSGLWQMIGTTAKNHGVKIQSGYDGRFSVVDSTDAALSYLGKLQGMFKDWQRAIMGYNAGEFRVLRAIKNSGNKNDGEDHWPHGLSPITYAYVAKIQALSCLISQPEKTNLSLPNTTQFIALNAVLVEENSASLDSIAKRYGLDADKLKQNNPAYKQGLISVNVPRRILMPAYLATASFANSNTDAPQKPLSPELSADPHLSEPRAGSHRVKNGDSLWSIAKRYGLSMENLRTLNGLGRKPVLRVGQFLKLLP
jgi:membrane-bound lytic murein transglycosylase D